MTLPKPQRRGPKPPRPIARRRRPAARAKAPKLKLKKLCDDLFSLVVRLRDRNECRLCTGKYRIQSAHLISRRYLATRWTTENAWALCWPCHVRYTFDPLGWDALCEAALGPVDWAQMKAAAQERVRPDYVRLAVALRALLNVHAREFVPEPLAGSIESAKRRFDRLVGEAAHAIVRET